MQITYLFDPLCGWCYGASPAIERLAALENVTLALSPTGLFAGEGARPLDAGFAQFAWQNDQRIARLTGLPFTEAYKTQVLDTPGNMFDSAPATLALVAVGLSEPGKELAVLKTLQHARYEDGRDTSDLETVAAILEETGFPAAARSLRAPDESLYALYRTKTSAARSDMAAFGANGVPALVAGDGANRRLLNSNALYGDFDQLAAQIAA
ncbi:DsbA family protein [uncultured Roseibium sp.]|uniref:DsbA family protein n=1 Tax=uncultured Roseibium sp. TaxID=1936171 RepID=UPI0026378851|nr:DsbA family protein [uncultured Roseibium sp.]